MAELNLFVFKSADDYYYLGFSTDVNRAFVEIRAGFGPEWTRLHRPSSIVQIIINAESYHETQVLYEYFNKYGIERVRGGPYTECVLNSTQITQIKTHLARQISDELSAAIASINI
jgi:hypothetical protein